jgi:hypothetical protein
VIIPIESRPASLKSSYRKCFGGNRYVMPDRLGAEALPIKPKDFGLALSSNRADNSGYAVHAPSLLRHPLPSDSGHVELKTLGRSIWGDKNTGS